MKGEFRVTVVEFSRRERTPFEEANWSKFWANILKEEANSSKGEKPNKNVVTSKAG